MLMFPIIQGRSAGWPTWIVLMLLAAVPAYGLFLGYERRLIGRGGDPLVNPIAVPDQDASASGNLITVVVALLGYAAPIYLILVIQSGFDRTALDAAMLTAPMPFLNMFGSLAAAPLVRRSRAGRPHDRRRAGRRRGGADPARRPRRSGLRSKRSTWSPGSA